MLDIRTAFFACTELLYGASGPGGATTGDLYWLADAPHLGRRGCRDTVCAPFPFYPYCPVVDLRGVWPFVCRGRSLLRHKTGNYGDCCAGCAPYRFAGAA